MKTELKTINEMLRQLHKNTHDGQLTLEYLDTFGDTYTVTYPMNWPSEKEELEVCFETLCLELEDIKKALDKIGLLSKSLGASRAENEAILDENTLDVWDILIRPFDDHGFDIDVLEEISDKTSMMEPLTNEEYKLAAQYEIWQEKQASQRIVTHGRLALPILRNARFYVKLLDMKAPEILQNNALYNLVKAFVVLWQGAAHVTCFSCGLVHQQKVCPHCGWEERDMETDEDFDHLITHQHNFFSQK